MADYVYVPFNLMPVSWRLPGAYVEFDTRRAVQGLLDYPTRILVIGQRLAAGSEPALTLRRPRDAEDARQLYGVGSQLARMVAAAKRANGVTEVQAMGVADAGSGVAATKTLTVTASANGAGTVYGLIAGQEVRIGTAASQAQNTIATNLAAAINALPELPVTAAASTNVVTLTAKHAGEMGNAIDARFNHYEGQSFPPGVSIAVASGVAGSGNPDIQTALDAIGDEWFTDLIVPWTDTTNLNKLHEWLAARDHPTVQKEGFAWLGASATVGTLTTLAQGRNSPFMSIAGFKGMPTPPWEVAAITGAAAAYESDIDPAKPIQNVELPWLIAPVKDDRFRDGERNQMLFDGLSTYKYDVSGRVIMERLITTYRQAPSGAADVSWLQTETRKTVAYLRYDIRNSVLLNFPRSKLADDGTNFGLGADVVTPKVMRNFLIGRALLWEQAGLVEDIKGFKDNLIVGRHPTDTERMDALIPPNIVNGLRVFAGLLQFKL